MSTCYRPGGMRYPYNGEFNLDYEDDWNTLSVYEKLCFIKHYFDTYKAEFLLFQEQLVLKEDSSNINLNRLLSEFGDFTGTWFGNSYTDITTDILINSTNIDGLTDQIEFLTQQFADGATGLVIECGYFNDNEIVDSYDGGVW